MKKRDLKNAYFEKQRECHFLPQTCSSAIPMTSAPAAAKHVAEAFRDWANRFGFPPGEADVLMSLMGSLGGIATADDRVLESVPIDDRSKRILYAFFGSDGVVEQPAVATMTAAVTPSPFQIPLPPSVPPQQLAVASSIPHPMERAFATQVLVAPPLPSVVGTRTPFSNRTNSQPPSSCSTFPFPRQQAMHPPRNPSYAAPTSSPMGFSAAAAAAASSYCHQQNHMATTENMDAFCGVSYPTSSRAAASRANPHHS